jgi:hypothetical protein
LDSRPCPRAFGPDTAASSIAPGMTLTMPIMEKTKLCHSRSRAGVRAHDVRNAPLTTERLINASRRGCRFSAAATFDAAHGLVNEVDKQSVLRRALAALRQPEHRPHRQWPGKGRLAVVDRGKETRSQPRFGQRRGQIVRRNLGHDARLDRGKRSRRIRYVICLF